MKLDIFEIAKKGSVDKMKVATENNIDINVKNEFGWSPLHIAISHEQENMALFLLNHDADATIQDKEGYTPLHYAAEYNMYDVAKMILDKTPKVIHIENKHEEQPLWIAVRKSEAPDLMVKLFLSHGADKNHGEKGSTPFDLAKQFNDEDFIKIFEK